MSTDFDTTDTGDLDFGGSVDLTAGYGNTDNVPLGVIDSGIDSGIDFDDSGDFPLADGSNTGGMSWQQLLGGIRSILNGTSSAGQLGQLAALTGLGGLLNMLTGANDAPRTAGYQGGIPVYTFNREQTPISQQRPAGYRPGAGGISYFTPATYSYVKDARAPQDFHSGIATVTPASATNPGTSTIPTNPSQGVQALAAGGSAHSSGARFLRGPGDGVSDDIKAHLTGSGEPARLADGEFVLPARIVSEIGNGSSEAGARKLYEMMDRVEAMSRKAKRGEPSGADKELHRIA